MLRRPGPRGGAPRGCAALERGAADAALEGHHALRKAYAEDRLARLEGAIRALARRVKGPRGRPEYAQVQAQEEARAQDRARRLEMARVELEDLAPRVFAKRGGDTDVLVAADHLRASWTRGGSRTLSPCWPGGRGRWISAVIRYPVIR